MTCDCKNHEEQACDCESHSHACSCGCDCGCGEETAYFQRRFQTKAEQIEELEDYLHDLKLEVQAVEEHLSDLRK